MSMKAGGELVPGGLAMIIGGSNMGAVVELVHPTYPGCIYNAPDGRRYRLKADGEPGFLVRGPGFVSQAFGGNEGYKKVKHLLPINPSADPVEITQQQECEV